MKRTLFLSALLLSLLIFSPASSQAATDTSASPAQELVKTFYAALTDTMKQGAKLGFEGRYNKLGPTITKIFNFPLMARYAVGLNWGKASHEERQNLAQAFAKFSIATYASRFATYNGELFEVKGETKTTIGDTMVETKLTPSKGDPVTLNYLVRKDETGALRIVDVYLDASISELATRRAEFTSIIKRDGLPALILSLESKVTKMKSPPLD